MDINAKITGIKYSPVLCESLKSYKETEFEEAFHLNSVFLLNLNEQAIAISKWVSPKRTRSYPYSRVYNTLNHGGKKVTIIPFVKDEGASGDRDFIQWDTISLMSLLGVYVIISFYSNASKNVNFPDKITDQVFDTGFIFEELNKLLSYQSDALHWNIEQINNIIIPANLARDNYTRIQSETGVKMHSISGIDKRIETILQGKDIFMHTSRNFAKEAQLREIQTNQPKEKITYGIKAQINITNYLGGTYFFTCDEAKIVNNDIQIIEAKHTKYGSLPSIDDIKDALIKMILFSNLKDVFVDGVKLNPVPILKLTSENGKIKKGNTMLEPIIAEAKANRFKIIVNDESII